MAGDRVVKVSLQAQVSNYLANMEAASKGTKKVAETLEQQKAASIAAAKAQGEAAAEVGRGMVAVGALALVGVGLAIKKYADFDEAMSNVKAATQETAENMGLLRDAALDAGARTVFSATEAANAIEELGKAGLSTKDILEGGLDGALDLASAGQLGVAEAAGIAATALKTFNLRGSDMSHVADLLAAGAGKAMGDVSDLAMAMSQAGLVAESTGLSIEETTGTLAAFASKGLLGSDAGTSLKSMLQRLTPQSKEAQAAMDELGISAYDASGKFIGMEALAGNLTTSFKGLSAEQRQSAMTTIFGSDAVRAATVLYTEGAKGIASWNDKVNDQGYAAKVAADRLDNLKGDVEQLGGAFDTYLIKSGSGANDTLRLLTQVATGLVTAIGDLPTPVLNAGLALGGIVAVVGLVGGSALIAIPKVAAFKTTLATLGVSGSTAAKGIGLASGALAVAGIAFALWAGRQAEAAANTAEFKDSLDQVTGATTKYTRELVAKKLAEGVAFEAAKEAGISQKELTDAVIEGGEALEKVQAKLSGNNNVGTFFTGVGIRAGNAALELNNMSGELEGSAEQLEHQKAAAKGSSDSSQTAADAYHAAADRAAELQSNLKKLIDTINESNGVGQDAVSANAAYRASLAEVDDFIDQARKGVEGYVLGLDQSTAAGSSNMKMLSDLARSYQDSATAQLELDGNVENYTTNLRNGQQAVLDRARALGATDEQIRFLSQNIAAMPSEKQVKILVDTAAAAAQFEDVIRRFDGRHVNLIANVAGVRATAGTGVIAYAGGGTVHGPGTSKSDSVVARLSVGEEVIQEPYASRNRALLKQINSGAFQGFANGGTAGYAQPRYAAQPQVVTVQSGSPTGGTNVHITAPAIETQDPQVYATIIGREFARRLAG